MTLTGRQAVVTGAGRGIGLAIAAELARRGADVTLLGRDSAALEAGAADLALRFRSLIDAIRCDVTDEAAVKNAFKTIRENRGDPSILVNNAGLGHGGSFMDTDSETWRRLFDVNVLGARHTIAQALPAMLAAGVGRIVNVASISGLRGTSHTAAYTASKHALVGLTRALAAEVARAGITVNAVCPGYTDTDMARMAVDNLVRAGRTPDEALARIARTNPYGRLVRPEEVASMVGWLCSAEAEGVNGQAIVIAGGEPGR